MQKVKIDIKGIERDVSPAWAPVGSCQDVVNLRPKDGATRPVLPKKLIWDGGGVTYIHKVYSHNALPPNHYIIERHVPAGEILKGYLQHVSITSAGNIRQKQTLVGWDVAEQDGFEYDLDMGFNITGDVIDELLSVSFIGDICVVSLKDKTTLHLYKDERYEINAPLSDIPEPRLAISTHDHITVTSFGNDETPAGAMASYYEKTRTEELQKRYNGHFMVIATYRMTDGTLVKQGLPAYGLVGISNMGYQNRRMLKGGSAAPYQVRDGGYAKIKTHIKENIPREWHHVLSSIDIYAAFFKAYKDPNNDELDAHDFTTNLVFDKMDLDKEFENQTFHRIHSIPVELPSQSGDIVIDEDIDIDLENLHSKEILPVDQFTHHDFCFRESMTYNGRLHAGDTETNLFKGHILSLPQLDKWNSAYISRVIGGVHSVVDSNFGTHVGSDQPVFRVFIDTDDGTKTVTRELPKNMQLIHASGKIHLMTPRVVTYPHPGATKFQIIYPRLGKPTMDSLKGYVVYEGNLKRHFAYGFNYHIMDESLSSNSISEPPPGDVTHRIKVYFIIQQSSQSESCNENTTPGASYQLKFLLGADNTQTQIINTTDSPVFWSIEDGVNEPFDSVNGLRTWFNNQELPWGLKILGVQATGDFEFNITFGSDVYLIFENTKNHQYGSIDVWNELDPIYSGSGAQSSGWDSETPVFALTEYTLKRGKPIKEPNRLQLSGLNNPFVWPAVNSYRLGQDKYSTIKHLSVQSAPTSEGQFGYYPLIAFTDTGIYLMDQGQDTVYGTSIGISDMVISGETLPMEGMLLFTTKDGLFLLEGRNIKELNRYLIGNKTYETADTDTPENPITETIDGKLFLQNAVFAYDFQHREAIIASPQYGYHYRYNPAFGVFFMATQGFDGVVIKQGSYQGIEIHGENRQFMKVYDIASDDNTVEQVRIYFKTNPQNIGVAEFKKLMKMLYYCDAETISGGYLMFHVFGSNIALETEFPMIQRSLVGGGEHSIYMVVGKTPFSVRYFIFMLSGKVKADSVFHHIDAEVKAVLPGRLR